MTTIAIESNAVVDHPIEPAPFHVDALGKAHLVTDPRLYSIVERPYPQIRIITIKRRSLWQEVERCPDLDRLDRFAG